MSAKKTASKRLNEAPPEGVTYEYANPHYRGGPAEMGVLAPAPATQAVADAGARNLVHWFGISYEDATEIAATAKNGDVHTPYFAWLRAKREAEAQAVAA